ncbi:MAG TPA: hypothetical protein VHX61_08625 [Rhizomicrobium sp.]|jgi:hypothetical protein|nr:hypothetical protein [Rhizomicrobium sp.]
MTDDSSEGQGFDGPVRGIPGAIVREVAGLPEHLPNARIIGPATEVAPGALLFGVPGIARYLIRDGQSIEVAPVPDGDRDAARLFLHTSARGTLIHQRGELPLQGAAMAAPGGTCVAICGLSGAGKSTLAYELSRRGWLLLAEDVIRVSWSGSKALAWPSDDAVTLWRDACEAAGFFVPELKRVRAGLERYYVPLAPATTPAELNVVAVLRIAPGPGTFELTREQRLEILPGCVFRPRQVLALGLRDTHARMIAQVSGNCRMVGLDGAKQTPIREIADRLTQLL